MQARSAVALVVPAGRGPENLATLLRSLVRARAQVRELPVPALHVAVRSDCRWVDQMDAVAAPWRAEGGDVSWHFSPRGNATAMRNHAAQFVQAPWTAFLDDDVIVGDGYLARIAQLSAKPPQRVVQGVPHLCSNGHRLLARLEARNYEQGLASYRDSDGGLRTLDARNLFIDTLLIRDFRFDETLLFAGEGQELARRFGTAGIPIAYDEELRVYHRNRESVTELMRQKFSHGRGRAQLLAKDGPVDMRGYAARYWVRHFVGPLTSMVRRRLSPSDALYRVATNAVFWAGTLREASRGDKE
jgi:hypothetical protein